jgi:uncharacterized protein (DUF2342 family)
LALRCLYPQNTGNTIDFSQDRALSSTFADLVALRERLVEMEKLESTLKQTLQQAMGSASGAQFETGAVTWKKAKDSTGLDVAKLLKDQPDLLQRYPLVKTGSRRFLFL